ncbi:tetratricopeptide repeat protein [Pseudomonadota bacterium AL_CKDN230030165-1A_HGKHYDSX7]
MIAFTRPLLLAAALCAVTGASLVPAGPVLAAEEVPLSGEAFELADQAYKSYDAGKFADALAQVNGALKTRPDVARLQLLKVYTLQKLGRIKEARETAQAALKQGVDDPGLRAAVTNLRQGPAPGAGAGNGRSAAYNRAFPLATKAYADYNRGDMQAAAAGAERAVRIDPSQGAWSILWVDSLQAQQKFPEAEKAASAAIALGAPNKADLEARRAAIKRRIAIDPVAAAYRELAVDRPAAAIPLAREAVALAPDVSSYRLLLLTTLMLADQLDAAETAASDALVQDDENTVALVLRGYLKQRQGKTAEANADFDEALKQDWLDEDQRRNIRLIAIDGAIAAGDYARARSIIEPMDSKDEGVARRQKLIRAGKPAPMLTASNYPPPAQACRDTPYGTQCELAPSDEAGGGNSPAALAYAAYGRQHYQEAIEQAQRAVAASPDDPALQQLLTTALASGNAAQAAQAEQRLNAALAKTPQDPSLLMQRAYLRQRTGRPELALQDFRAARDTGKAPPTVILDEAYALSATGDNRQAVEKLKQAIDLDDTGNLKLDPQQRENTRGAIAGLSREWGAIASVGFRGARPASSSLDGAAISTPGDAAFSTAEVFWRPPATNNKYGTLEAYARLSNTIYEGNSEFQSTRFVDPCGIQNDVEVTASDGTLRSKSATGFPSTIGSLGLRYALSDTGVSFGLERRFFLGTATRQGSLNPASRQVQCDIRQQFDPRLQNATASYKLNGDAGGWMTYLTYGYYYGNSLRSDVPSWLTIEGYSQLGYAWDSNSARFDVRGLDSNGNTADRYQSNGKLKRDQAFASAELRVGQSFRLDAISNKLVVFPHAVLATDWLWQKSRVSGVDYGAPLGTQSYALSGNGKSWSMGVGPGIDVRYWFREDHYNAARSYFNLSMQYRTPIGGGATDRAKGFFMNMTMYY